MIGYNWTGSIIPKPIEEIKHTKSQRQHEFYALPGNNPINIPDDVQWMNGVDEDGTEFKWCVFGDSNPKQIEKRKVVSGTPILMGDGNYWKVPTLRYFPAGTALPTKLGIWDGKKVRRVTEEYIVAASFGESLFKNYLLNDVLPSDPEQMVIMAKVILATNYHITDEWIWGHGLLDDDSFKEIVYAALDWKTWTQFLGGDETEKKELLISCGIEQAKVDTFLASLNGFCGA